MRILMIAVAAVVRPGADATPVPKVISVEKVGDVFCGVGYYK